MHLCMHACTHLAFKELKIAFLYSSIDSFEARRADNLEKEALCNITYLRAGIVKIVDVGCLLPFREAIQLQ